MSSAGRVSIAKTERIIKTVATLKKDINIPLMIWGMHGIGKTKTVERVANDLGYEFVVLNLANQTPEDLLGQINGKGGYHRPNWMLDSTKPVIYFLDELNRAPKYVIQTIFNFVNEGRIHTHRIKKDDVVISACNPPSAAYEVTEFEDEAFWSRFCHLRMVPEKNEFINYIGGVVKNNIIQIAVENSKSLFQADSFDLPFAIKPDNRALEKVAHVFEKLSPPEVEDVGLDIISGLIGYDACAIVMETYRASQKEKVDIEEILNSTKYKFAEKDVEVINKINIFMVDWFKEQKGKEPSDKIVEGFLRYVKYIPRDIQVALLKQMNLNKVLFGDVYNMGNKFSSTDTDYIYKLMETSSDKKEKKSK